MNHVILLHNTRSYTFEQSCSFQLQVCVSMYDLFEDTRSNRINILSDKLYWKNISWYERARGSSERMHEQDSLDDYEARYRCGSKKFTIDLFRDNMDIIMTFL